MAWIDRQQNFIGLALNFLYRRKGKHAALVLVYTLVVFLLTSVLFLTYAIRKEASAVLKDAPEIIVQKLVAGRQDLIPEETAQKLRSIAGVASVRGRLWGYYYDSVFRANYTLMVPEGSKYAKGSIAIGSGVSRTSVASEGNMMPFRTYDGQTEMLTVQEIFSSDSELVSSDLILLSEPDFRRIFGIQEGLVTDLVVSVRNPREVATVASKIVKILPGARPVTRSEILRTYDAVFNWRAGIVLLILAGCVVAFMIFSWDKASGLSAEERKEIGILKATGWETSDVILLKFWEGMIISALSFSGGVLFAYLHVFFTSAALFSPVLKGWSVLYPEFRLVPFIDAYQIAAIFCLTVVPYTAATVIPAWRAANTDPDAVMRA
ncbi:MAG: FtsX-like permease family protein [Nitrospiraceae bacterium]|nr:FtsX-like permease family protein [Nitrospiraceae bacterium]